MEIVKSAMQFKDYKVDKLQFSVVEGFQAQEDQTINLNPSFQRKITKNGENEYDLTLGVTIKPETNEPTMPFEVEVVVSGSFILSGIDDPEKHIKVNAVAVLFPYLRSSLSMLMSLANVEPFFIPTINLVAMFQRLEENSNCRNSEQLQ